MMYEFFSFEAYEAACKRDTSLLGFFPTEAAFELKITRKTLSRAIRRGSVDVVRVCMSDGFNLYVTLGSMHRYWADRSNHLYPLSHWQLLLFCSDQERGVWARIGLE